MSGDCHVAGISSVPHLPENKLWQATLLLEAVGGKNHVMRGRPKKPHRALVLTAGIIASVMLVGCGGSVERASPAPAPTPSQPSLSPVGSPEPERSVSQAIKELVMADGNERAGLLRAWRRVPDNDHYRIAQTSDFVQPRVTYEYGEIAGAYGLPAIIVDKTRTADRFSLIVFIRRPSNRFDTYWIYRNMDLSKYAMSRASGDIFVEYPGADGNTTFCEIQWDKKSRKMGLYWYRKVIINQHVNPNC
jgi:hypothetical protein